MGRAVNTALLIIGILAWSVRKYGMLAMMTRKFAKHAAVGRAKRSWFWNTPVRDHSGLAYSAPDLIARLRQERMAASYGLAA